jgi:AbrB family looped-hinge helix DNA binding protein
MWYNSVMAHKIENGRCTLTLGARGRIVLPAEVCRLLELKEGDGIILKVEKDRRLTLFSVASAVRSVRGMYKHLNAGGSMADELIRERREEVAREEREP